MGISNYLENKELDHVYGKAHAYVPPTSMYAQLFTSDPTDAGTGTQIALARAQVLNSLGMWPDAAGGIKSNGAKISFGATTGQMSLPNATHVGLYDALTGGNLLDYGPLNASLATADKLEVFIPIGGITITRD